jgi:hypothetical protein
MNMSMVDLSSSHFQKFPFLLISPCGGGVGGGAVKMEGNFWKWATRALASVGRVTTSVERIEEYKTTTRSARATSAASRLEIGSSLVE